MGSFLSFGITATLTKKMRALIKVAFTFCLQLNRSQIFERDATTVVNEKSLSD